MPTDASSPNWPLKIGCPVWACDRWADTVYPARTPRKDWLAWYTRTFNTVEGNSTFYALPTIEMSQRWAENSAVGFRFCLKFPRTISHDLQLVGADEETQKFLSCTQPLAAADRLGPTFLQLGPRFGPDRFHVLSEYLRKLPSDRKWAVELRHHDWFDQGSNEQRVNELLRSMGIDKVLFDSRPLYQSPPDDEIERASQGRKPKTPVRQTVTAGHPFLRIVGRNRVEMTDKYLDQWAPIVAGWISQGLQPYVFTHTPDDALAPQLAGRFIDRLRPLLDDSHLILPKPPASARQLSLLD